MNPQQYITYWDNFVNLWIQNPMNQINSFNFWNPPDRMNLNALPEPYCGDPKNFSSLILQLNPGQDDPLTQGHPNGTFVQYIKNNGGYYNWARHFPYVPGPAYKGPPAHPGGQKFWNGRFSWINRLIKSANCPEGNYTPLAIDICPWHSQSWGSYIPNEAQMIYIGQNILAPAECLITNGSFKIILCIGNQFNSIFKFFQYQHCATFNNAKPLPNWPQNNGKPLNRTYNIWKSTGGSNSEIIDCQREEVVYLVTHYQGGFHVPASRFEPVEVQILNYIVNILKYKIC